jgi:hypothetical protein
MRTVENRSCRLEVENALQHAATHHRAGMRSRNNNVQKQAHTNFMSFSLDSRCHSHKIQRRAYSASELKIITKIVTFLIAV